MVTKTGSMNRPTPLMVMIKRLSATNSSIFDLSLVEVVGGGRVGGGVILIGALIGKREIMVMVRCHC